jgi:hypothetical protein
MKKALLHDTRGAMMAEGVIVLPLFIIVLAAIMYFHNLYAAKLDNSVQARSCAWTYAVNGCEKKFLTKGCKAAEVSDGFDAIESAMGGNPFEEEHGKDREVDQALAGANRVGLALLGLREGVKTQHGSRVNKPSILGGGKVSVASNYTVMCNEREFTVGEIITEAYCSIAGTTGLLSCDER